jgi:hypothetical protein
MSAAYKVGDVAYGNFGAYGRIDVAQGTVSKVTPTGQVTVDFQRGSIRFKNDREICGHLCHPARLINADDFARLFAFSLERAARKKVTDSATELARSSQMPKAELRHMATVLLAQIEALPELEAP